jgi:hypothetical protein
MISEAFIQCYVLFFPLCYPFAYGVYDSSSLTKTPYIFFGFAPRHGEPVHAHVLHFACGSLHFGEDKAQSV